MAAEYGPLVKAREALGERWPELRSDLIALSEAMNTDEDASASPASTSSRSAARAETRTRSAGDRRGRLRAAAAV